MKKIIKLFNWDKSDLVKVLFGSFLSCLAVNIFIVPNNLYTGGVLGIEQLTRSIINTVGIIDKIIIWIVTANNVLTKNDLLICL